MHQSCFEDSLRNCIQLVNVGRIETCRARLPELRDRGRQSHSGDCRVGSRLCIRYDLRAGHERAVGSVFLVR